MDNSSLLPRPVAVLVEDDRAVVALLEYLFSREGFQVLVALDGQDAHSMITSLPYPPAFVLLDLMLPYVDGYELLQLIRSLPGWKKTPVVILSAKSQEDDIVRAFKLDASDYVVKPFRPHELRARIHRLVKVEQQA